MTKFRAVTVAMAITFSATMGAHSGPVPAYVAGIFVQSAGGGGCLDQSGAAFAGVLQYAGSVSKDTLRVPLPQLGAMSTQVLTVTSGLGGNHPSGTFTWKGVGPSGTIWNVSGDFAASVTTVDANSLVFAINETYGSCSESSYISATRLKPQ